MRETKQLCVHILQAITALFLSYHAIKIFFANCKSQKVYNLSVCVKGVISKDIVQTLYIYLKRILFFTTDSKGF